MPGKRKFAQGDWVRVKYGEYAGSYGKISMLEKNGDYVLIPYDKSDTPGAMITLNARAMEKLEPFVFDEASFVRLLRGEILYSEMEKDIFPAFNVCPEKDYELEAEDICCALKNINSRNDPIGIFKEWFWLINNIFYERLDIKGRYNEELFTDIPETDDEIFSVAFGMCERMYWRLEERLSHQETIEKYIVRFDRPVDWDGGNSNIIKMEESAYRVICDDVISRVEVYLHNRDLPKSEWEYSDSEKHHIISGYEDDGSLEEATDEALELYRRFVYDLYKKGDLQALKILAWGFYEGNRVYPQDWVLSEKYLLELFEKFGDPFAANSLGYIYFYGRVNGAVPDYEKAFKYFSIGALAGVDESIYKAGEMMIKGIGVAKNVDVGLNMIVDGYRSSLDEFCKGEYSNKLADYAVRMGNACRDGLIYGMGMRDAYKFYLEARFAIKKRREISDYYGDDQVEARIETELAHIRERLCLSSRRRVLRGDLPIYVNQLFEDRFPLKVEIDVPEGSRKGTLTISRFRFGEGMFSEDEIPEDSEIRPWLTVQPILAVYPELSYAHLTTEMKYHLEGVSAVYRNYSGPFVLCDGFRRNDATEALEFFSNGEMVAAVDAKWYTIRIDK